MDELHSAWGLGTAATAVAAAAAAAAVAATVRHRGRRSGEEKIFGKVEACCASGL